MDGFVPSGYVTLEQTIDEIGRHMMPSAWQGQETTLLKRDDHVIEEVPGVGGLATATRTAAERLNWAVNYLIAALFAGDVKAAVAREDGGLHDFPPALWMRPGIRAVFRSGELPVDFRTAVEGHRAGSGRRRILLLESDLRRLLRRLGTTRGRPDVEAQFGAWLARKIDEVAGAEPPQKKRLWVEARGLFGPELPFRSFERIWAATVPANWRRLRGAGPAKPVGRKRKD
jgi:hypothetical protein